MKIKLIKTLTISLFILLLFPLKGFLEEIEDEGIEQQEATYLKSVIEVDHAIEVKKSNIFDASNSFISDPERNINYFWDFGDGNSNEGIEVLHAYEKPGYYTITLTIDDEIDSSKTSMEIFVYNKLIILITDSTEDKDRIDIIKTFAEKNGVFLKVIESFRSSTEFISEEILTKKLTEETSNLIKAQEIVIWTKENAGINALSRFLLRNPQIKNALRKQIILIIDNNIGSKRTSAERQFNLIQPKKIVLAKESALEDIIESEDSDKFMTTLEERGRDFIIIDSSTGKIMPWNFMTYFVNLLVSYGIPDNTIALLLLLPVIATVVAIMRQVIGVTTFGIYTPSIITLSFLIIGIYAGLLTLLTAIIIGSIARPLLNKIRMLFIPKMAIVITLVTFVLFLVIISSISLGLFDATFLSIAIFPMLILSTLVEKFVSAKGEKSYKSASVIMFSTLIVSLIAYFIAGGEINLYFTILRIDFFKQMMLNYPELIFLIIIINILLGKWTGLRLMERIRFREIFRHTEE